MSASSCCITGLCHVELIDETGPLELDELLWTQSNQSHKIAVRACKYCSKLISQFE